MQKKEQQRRKLQFSEQFVLNWFFDAKLELFADCVTIRHYTSPLVTKRQRASKNINKQQVIQS